MTLADISTMGLRAVEADQFDDRMILSETPLEDTRILVVDDNATVVELMSRLLAKDGFPRVRTAGDGRRALAMIREHPPDVVVLDVHLPQVDGFEVLHEIVRHENHNRRPTGVLAISGDATPATGQTMMWAGADDFITRPFDSAEFTLRVRRIANQTRALRRAIAYSDFLERRVRDLTP